MKVIKSLEITQKLPECVLNITFSVLKVNNILLELENDFVELKHRELKDSDVKIKRDIEELFFKANVECIDDMDKFEQKEMKKIRPIKNT